MNKQTKNKSKQAMMAAVGVFVLLLGISLVLTWWRDVVVLFRGVIGMILAVAGLLVLYSIKK